MKAFTSIPAVRFIVLRAAVMVLLSTVTMRAQIRVGSFSGPVTSDELTSFHDYVTTLTPAPDNIGNNWAQGHAGEQVKAMGLVYEVGHDSGTLDQMIRFCDAVLSERNDLASAPVGQHVMWTGDIAPVWPNEITTTPINTGGEQGDPVGHLGNCARLILQTPAIWHTAVAIGDPHGYGATYLERARTFVQGADFAIDNHILKYELDLSNGDHQYFSANDPYKPGQPVPWNQQMMFNYGFQNLATAHELLADDPARVTHYRQIVQDSFNWFFTSGVQTYTDPDGRPAYNWGYAMPSIGGEDQNHAALDVAGFARVYMTGNYGITAAQMTNFADTIVDVLTESPTLYAGRVDGTTATGHADSTNYLRSAFLFLAEFRPDAYQAMLAGARLTENGTTTAYDNFSRFLWVKYRRSLQGQPESATKVNSLVSVDVARTGTVDELMLVRNASSSPLQGPLFLALSSAPVGVTLDNALAEGSKAGPYVPIPLGSELLPGQFTLVPVKLRAPNGNAQAAGWTVFSGEPE
jgi:hypothetical protein